MADSADSTTTSRVPFVIPNSGKGFTVVPNELYDLVIGSNFPPAAKILVLLVHRYSYGYKNRACFIDKSELNKLLPINHGQIPFLISGLIKFNILKGGPCKRNGKGGGHLRTFNQLEV